MFINVQAEVSTKHIMERMLEAHSPHYILYLLAETYGYHSPEWFADKFSKVLESEDES